MHRRKPELIRPAKQTPHGFKKLSDIDDQQGLRFHVSMIQFYRYNESMLMQGRDPVKVIREGVAQALVYYPFAGRLRKLVVECTSKGMMFIEADADVRLEQFGDHELLQPPFPCMEDLLFDVPGSGGILDSPLLLIQVTRLKCRGIIFALWFNHTMCDGSGIALFMRAVGEMARGATAPSTLPVWDRHLLSARVSPRITSIHREYEQGTIHIPSNLHENNNMAHRRTFYFGSAEIDAIRKLCVALSSSNCSTFELLTACLWRCRTLAIINEPNEEVWMMFTVDARAKFNNPPLPSGYYGNVIASALAVTTAGKLCGNPIGYAVELIRKAKAEVTEDYMRSVADFMVVKGWAHLTMVPRRSFMVSEVRQAGFREVDYGWGEAGYGGPAIGCLDMLSFYIPFREKPSEEKREDGVAVRICLPTAAAMETFVEALDGIFLINTEN